MTQPSNTVEAAALFCVLGNAKRLEIFRHLLDTEISVGQLAKALDVSRSALSQNLAKMRKVGAVKSRRDKQTVYYSCDSEQVRELLNIVDRFYVVEPSHD